jgi:hypothetical protein
MMEKLNMTNPTNIIGIANTDYFGAQNGGVTGRVNVAKMSGDIIPDFMPEEDVKAALKAKFEEDLAQAYLSAFNLIRLGVDPYPIAAAVFSDETTHPIFVV